MKWVYKNRAKEGILCRFSLTLEAFIKLRGTQGNLSFVIIIYHITPMQQTSTPIHFLGCFPYLTGTKQSYKLVMLC